MDSEPSTTEKIPLRLLADYWVGEHEKCCHPDEPIILGLIEDIDLDDRGDYRFWVQNDQVFLKINCPASIIELPRRKPTTPKITGKEASADVKDKAESSSPRRSERIKKQKSA